MAQGQIVGEVEEEEVVGEVEAVQEQKSAEVEGEGQGEWGVVVVEEEEVVVTEFECLEGTYPWVCWGTSGLEYVLGHWKLVRVGLVVLGVEVEGCWFAVEVGEGGKCQIGRELVVKVEKFETVEVEEGEKTGTEWILEVEEGGGIGSVLEVVVGLKVGIG